MSNELAAMALQLAMKNEQELKKLQETLDAGDLPTPDQWARLVQTIRRLNDEAKTLISLVQGVPPTAENPNPAVGLVQKVSIIETAVDALKHRGDVIVGDDNSRRVDFGSGNRLDNVQTDMGDESGMSNTAKGGITLGGIVTAAVGAYFGNEWFRNLVNGWFGG